MSTDATPEIEFTEWPVANLKPHPRQAEIFGDVSDSDVRQLADDIDENGLEYPPEILPDGKIICGHRRCRAVQLLGWDEVDVYVRHDLAAAGEAAVEAWLIKDNYLRRQLSPLQRAKCAAQLAGQIGGSASSRNYQRICKAVAEQLGVSAKTADRLLKIAQAPAEVQQAYDGGHISQVLASRVAGMSAERQAEIATDIADQGLPHAKDIVSGYFASPTPHEDGPTDFFRHLRRAITTALAELPNRLDEIEFAHWMVDDDIEALRDGEVLLRDLRARAEAAQKEFEQDSW